MSAAEWSQHELMLQRVATSLGADLTREVAFVGGCTVGLLVTDPFVREAVRYTEDVDVIVHVLGPGKWHQLERIRLQRVTGRHRDLPQASARWARQ